MNNFWFFIDRILCKFLRYYYKVTFLGRIKSNAKNLRILGKIYVNASNITIGDNLTIYPTHIFKGKIYSAYLFNVTAREDIQNINEKLFLNLDLKNKRSIALKDKKLLHFSLRS